MSGTLSIRTMRAQEVPLALDWAAAEGWNPGLADAGPFAVTDPGGFLLAELDGVPAATISVVNYDDAFAFLGFYIVRPELRGRGLGFRLWQAGLAHAGARSIGLDGVLAQQDNYAQQGFVFAHRNIRFAGVTPDSGTLGETVPLDTVPAAMLEADDARVFPAPRPAFLAAWRQAPGHVRRALLREGQLAGWGVIRPARAGFKIGPLVAQDAAAAEAVLGALMATVGAGRAVVLDVPEPNRAGVALARSLGLAPVFETARMYRGPVRAVELARLYGVTSFELG